MKNFNYYNDPVNRVQSYNFIKHRIFKENNYNPRQNPTEEDEKEEKRLIEIAVKEHAEICKKAHDTEEEFKKDLFEELDIQNNPKKDLLYSKAYERDHSYGFEEIYNVACNLVELIL